MAAALALARLGVALAQPPRDLADQSAHLLDLPRLDPGQRRIAQDLVAQIFGFLAAVEQQRLRDGVAHGIAQAVGRGREPFRQCRIGRGQIVEIVAQPRDAHRVEDAAGKNSALGEIADIGERRRIGRVGNRGGNRVAVLRQQHLGKRASLRWLPLGC